MTRAAKIAFASLVVLLLTAAVAWGAVAHSRLWVKRYNGAANQAERTPAIAVDRGENVIVVGASEVGRVEDFVTLKYNSSGTLLWQRRYNGGADDFAEYVTVDSGSNIYVTGKSWGSSRNGYDYITIKYSPFGVRLWLVRYNGVGSGNDRPRGIAVDAARNVHVTGTSCVVRTGALSQNDDIVTVKYSPTGALKWARRLYTSSTKNDGAANNGVGVDKSGNVFVTGFSVNTANNADYLVAKYNSAGTRLWSKRYDSPVHGNDFPKGLKVDGAGAVCVTGYVPENTNAYPPSDIVTVKWDALGTRKWVKRLGIAGHSDEPMVLAIGPYNSIVVCGYVNPGIRNSDMVLIKYDTNGVEKWNRTVNAIGARDSEDVATDVVVDARGDVYATGYATADGMDYMTVKHDYAGNFIWYAFYNGPGNDYDWRTRIAAGASSVYVVGESYGGPTTGIDFATIKYAK